MRNIPEDEARALLSRPMTCQDCGGWIPVKAQPGTTILGAGVVDECGVGAQMLVELVYRHGNKTNMTRYMFTIFKRYSYGKERIYQLEVIQTPMKIKDMHKLSHEHMGSARSIGNAKWASWEYDEVLAYFCAQTNITFKPPPSHPNYFALKGNR